MANCRTSSTSPTSFADGIGEPLFYRGCVHRPDWLSCTSKLFCRWCTRSAQARRGPSSYSDRYASERNDKPLRCTPSRRNVSNLSHWSSSFRHGGLRSAAYRPRPASSTPLCLALATQPRKQTRRRCLPSYLLSHTYRMHGAPSFPNRLVCHV